MSALARIVALLLALAVAAPTAALDRGDVRAAQEALLSLGYDPGPIDGLVGPKVRDAVRAFQAANGLTETGRLDDALLSRLRRDAAPAAEASPLPPVITLRAAPVPPPPAPPPTTPSLTGQTWRIMDVDGGQMTVGFAAGGRVTGPTFAADMTWRQDADAVWLTFETPLGGRVDRQGRITGPDAMAGEAQMAADGAPASRWRWRATRLR